MPQQGGLAARVHLCGPRRLLTLLLATVVGPVLSAPPEETVYQEQSKLIRAPQSVTRLGEDIFGDKINLYTGSLEFVQTDVSVPGNDALPVAVGRRLVVGREAEAGMLFGGWDLEIPHLHGIFSKELGWRSNIGPKGSFDRCTSFGAPPTAPASQGRDSAWDGTEYWQGSFLYIPGAGDQEMLLRSAWFTSAPGGASARDYPIVTRDKWTFRCLPSLANGAPGEGFVAVSPESTEYRFDWMVTREVSTLTKMSAAPLPGVTAASRAAMREAGGTEDAAGAGVVLPDLNAARSSLRRVNVWMLPTRITDRHGNSVTYTYDPQNQWQLVQVLGTDASGSARKITFTYATPGSTSTNLVTSVSDGTRTWRYNYDVISPDATLQTVTLPDASQWQLGGLASLRGSISYDTGSSSCEDPGIILAAAPLKGVAMHPSGAAGEFTMMPMRHGRAGVAKICDHLGPGREVPYYARYFDKLALTKKTISGPGLPMMSWDTAYLPSTASWAPCVNCETSKVVEVSNPEHHQTRYVFGTLFQQTEGQLQQTEVYDRTGKLLRTTTFAYAEPVPPFGSSEQARGDGVMAARATELSRRQISQDGVEFIWSADDFDRTFGMPVHTIRNSSLGANLRREETTSYDNNVPKWLIGRIGKVTERSGKVMVENRYNPATGDLDSVWRFGRREWSMTYHPDGNVKTLTDGRNNTTTLTDYKRGIARRVNYADGNWERAEVDDLGLARSISRLIGSNGETATTALDYDVMGRLARITHPAGDVVNWNPVTIELNQIWEQEYDLQPGHWRQIVQAGSGIDVTYLDALWRPVFTDRWDQADRAATGRFVMHRYDFAGRQTFESFPKRSYGEVSDGVHQEYDALGRPTVRSTTSELGMLYDGNSYSAGFRKTYTDAGGNSTTYSYQAFDEPSEEAVSAISYPEGVSATIARDVFGKPAAVTRSGGGKSLTRSYVYDEHERLCKTVEPETKATILDYDGANNVLWGATGLALTAPNTCDRTSVPGSARVVYGYDNRNRLTSTTFGDGSPGIKRTYTPDGLPESLTSAGAEWRYAYNKRRLNRDETLTYAGLRYHIGRDYDANGSLARLTYPDDTTVSYSPNALGEPSQVGKFAQRISYHPNGAVQGFVYGNGIVHTMVENVRGLPQWSIDDSVLRDNYGYDRNANVVSIVDGQEGYHRAMEYDLLDRLTHVNMPSLWGDAWYSYDAFDNLASTRLTVGGTARATTHMFDPSTNLLSTVANSAGSKYNYGFRYDARGNVVQRGSQAFRFDLGNRMTSATGKATYAYDGQGRRFSIIGNDGVNRIQVYSQEGQLLYASSTSQSPRTGTKYIYLHKHLVAEVKR
jgi:YD repeat-containing protein